MCSIRISVSIWTFKYRKTKRLRVSFPAAEPHFGCVSSKFQRIGTLELLRPAPIMSVNAFTSCFNLPDHCAGISTKAELDESSVLPYEEVDLTTVAGGQSSKRHRFRIHSNFNRLSSPPGMMLACRALFVVVR